MSKRTLHSFFAPPAKRTKADVATLTRIVSPPRVESRTIPHELETVKPGTSTKHDSYPMPISDLPDKLSETVEQLLGTTEGRAINDQPHLDLLYFQPLVPQPAAKVIFSFLRASLPFYRVCYTINRFGKSVDINTPRFTTVFGLDETSRFQTTSDVTTNNITDFKTTIVETSSSRPVLPSKYKCTPRPIPPCLHMLKNLTEALTGDTYNFMLINYYATGTDSITYHSDDERFLGLNPSIASYTFGARRDFLMKHKPPTKPGDDDDVESKSIKLPLGSGDMILMRGETQSHWLHSIPKRKGGEADRGRINITLRKAMIPAGTENYYRYNVGDGPVYRWDETAQEMRLWQQTNNHKDTGK